MHIGVLGTGDVGRTLSQGLVEKGHNVMIGTRDPYADKIQSWQKMTENKIQVGTFAEAADYGKLLIFSIAWSHAENAIHLAEAENFTGKTVLDTTNPLRVIQEGKPPTLAAGKEDSAGEQLQRWLPEANIVKALNIVGHTHMVEPSFPEGEPDMFIAGNSEKGKKAADALIQELGWPQSIDLGNIEMSRYLESMAMVWIKVFFDNNFNANHAFKLLRK